MFLRMFGIFLLLIRTDLSNLALVIGVNTGIHTTAFVYAETEGRTTRVTVKSLNSPDTYWSFSTHSLVSVYAISPSLPYIAIADATDTISVYNLRTKEASTLDVKLLQAQDAFATDFYYRTSRSLVWSPDDKLLAFIGRTSKARVDIYIYDTQTRKTKNLTASINLVSDLVNISGWSPDGKWLAYIATGKQTTNAPIVEGNIVNLQGKSVQLLPSQSVCRLTWSKDSKYLATNTACSRYSPDKQMSAIAIFTFDEEGNSSHIIIQDANTNTYYEEPIWKQDNTVQVVKIETIATADLASIVSAHLMIYDNKGIEQQSTQKNINQLQLDDIARNSIQQGEWLFWLTAATTSEQHLSAYNLATNQLLGEFPATASLCPLEYIRVATQNEYLALLDGCNLDFPSSIIRIYNLLTGLEEASFQGKISETIPIGFVKF